jgi:hypothetical protein
MKSELVDSLLWNWSTTAMELINSLLWNWSTLYYGTDRLFIIELIDYCYGTDRLFAMELIIFRRFEATSVHLRVLICISYLSFHSKKLPRSKIKNIVKILTQSSYFFQSQNATFFISFSLKFPKYQRPILITHLLLGTVNSTRVEHSREGDRKVTSFYATARNENSDVGKKQRLTWNETELNLFFKCRSFLRLNKVREKAQNADAFFAKRWSWGQRRLTST